MEGISNGPDSNGLDGDVTAMRARITALETEVKTFGQKRAYFMDIYKRKEGEYYFYFVMDILTDKLLSGHTISDSGSLNLPIISTVSVLYSPAVPLLIFICLRLSTTGFHGSLN